MRALLSIAAVVLYGALAVGPAAAQDSDATPVARPGLPPVEDFFRRPKYSDFTLSPDGKLLAAKVPVNDRQNVALIDLDKGTATALTSFANDDVQSYRWVGDRMLEVKTANLSDASGLQSIRQIVLIDTDGRRVRELTATGRRSPPTIIATLDRAGEDMIITSNDRSDLSLDAYRFNPRTNQKTLLTLESPGDVTQYVADRAGQVRVAVSIVKGATRQIVSTRRTNDDKWTTLRDEPIDRVTLSPIDFGFDNRTLYVYAPANDDSGRRAVYAFDTETNQLGPRVYQNPTTDAGALRFDWVKQVPSGIVDDSDAGVTWIDPDWKRLQASIDAVLPGTHNRLSLARYEPSKVVVTTESETQPPVFYFLDRKTSKMEEIAVAYPSLKASDLSPRRFVRYDARDGLSIPGWLTMPTRPDGAKPPLIVDIHGGPFVKTAGFGYDREAQFFASRGYAVLQPDYRGTSGYGSRFERAGWRQYGLAMQDDVTDGVKWLIETGKVDPDRVCLFGGSYGGYATLWGLAKEPKMFRCGVAFVALADLELKFDVGWSDYQRNERDGSATNAMVRTVGDPDQDREKMRAVSPLYHADLIQAPLLLAYGASDQRVPVIHGNRMRSALDKYGKVYEWKVYSNEGHGFTKEDNVFDFYRRVDAFLAKNLAPRTAP